MTGTAREPAYGSWSCAYSICASKLRGVFAIGDCTRSTERWGSQAEGTVAVCTALPAGRTTVRCVAAGADFRDGHRPVVLSGVAQAATVAKGSPSARPAHPPQTRRLRACSSVAVFSHPTAASGRRSRDRAVGPSRASSAHRYPSLRQPPSREEDIR